MADPGFQSFFEKVRNHQGAVNAMMRVGQVMKDKGGHIVDKLVEWVEAEFRDRHYPST